MTDPEVQGVLHGGLMSPLSGGESYLEGNGVAPGLEPPHIAVTLTAVPGCREEHWDFMGLEPGHPPHSPVVLFPGTGATGSQGGTHLSFSTTLQRPEKPDNCET